MTSRSLGVAQHPVVQPKSFTFSSSVDFFLSKIQLIYGLCVAAVASFGAYNLVRGTQLLLNAPMQLSSNFNAVRCEIFLAEIKDILKNNASADITSPLEQCKRLVLSMSLVKQQQFLLELINHYSKIDTDYARTLVQRLSSPSDILLAAQMLTTSSSSESLLQIYTQGLQRLKAQRAFTSLVPVALAYAQAFHSLANAPLKNKALSLAWDCVDQCPEVNSKLYQLCSIAQTYRTFNDPEQVKKTLEKAFEISCQCPDNSSPALFAVAKQFLDTQDNDQDNDKIQAILKLFLKEESPTIKGTVEKLRLAAEFRKRPSINMPPELSGLSAETELNQLLQNLKSNPPTDVAQKAFDYQELAEAYLEFDMKDKSLEALNFALSATKVLSTEATNSIASKTQTLFKLLQRVAAYNFIVPISDNMTQQLVELLLYLYPAARHKLDLQNSISTLLLQVVCNRKNYTQLSNTIFKRYLTDILTRKEDATDKITRLTLFDSSLSSDQYQQMLEAAESLLPQVPSHSQTSMAITISRGYLKINWQKSLEFLKSCHKKLAMSRAREHLTVGAISAIVAGVMYINPYQLGGPLLTLSAGLYSLYRN